MNVLDRLLGRLRRPAEEKRVRIDAVLQLRGIAPHLPLDYAEALDAAAAMKRCRECPCKQICDEAIGGGDVKRLSLFCPNAHYVEHLRSRSLEFLRPV